MTLDDALTKMKSEDIGPLFIGCPQVSKAVNGKRRMTIELCLESSLKATHGYVSGLTPLLPKEKLTRCTARTRKRSLVN